MSSSPTQIPALPPLPSLPPSAETMARDWDNYTRSRIRTQYSLIGGHFSRKAAYALQCGGVVPIDIQFK